MYIRMCIIYLKSCAASLSCVISGVLIVVCVCVCVCARACMHVCIRVCVHACECVDQLIFDHFEYSTGIFWIYFSFPNSECGEILHVVVDKSSVGASSSLSHFSLLLETLNFHLHAAFLY